MIRRVVPLFLLLFVPTAFAKPPAVVSWQAGTAKVVITPKEFMWISGYGARTKPATVWSPRVEDAIIGAVHSRLRVSGR